MELPDLRPAEEGAEDRLHDVVGFHPAFDLGGQVLVGDCAHDAAVAVAELANGHVFAGAEAFNEVLPMIGLVWHRRLRSAGAWLAPSSGRRRDGSRRRHKGQMQPFD
jgi:hypothetical protein